MEILLKMLDKKEYKKIINIVIGIFILIVPSISFMFLHNRELFMDLDNFKLMLICIIINLLIAMILFLFLLGIELMGKNTNLLVFSLKIDKVNKVINKYLDGEEVFTEKKYKLLKNILEELENKYVYLRYFILNNEEINDSVKKMNINIKKLNQMTNSTLQGLDNSSNFGIISLLQIIYLDLFFISLVSTILIWLTPMLTKVYSWNIYTKVLVIILVPMIYLLIKRGYLINLIINTLKWCIENISRIFSIFIDSLQVSKQLMKYLSLICLLTWGGFIFYNSTESSSDSMDKSMVIVDYVVDGGKEVVTDSSGSSNHTETEDAEILLSEAQKAKLKYYLNYIIRKSAHFIEYLVLALLLWWAMSHYELKLREIIIYCLFVVLLWATVDEYIQSFVGRTSSVRDVLLDFSGGGVGVLSICLFKKVELKNLYVREKVMNKIFNRLSVKYILLLLIFPIVIGGLISIPNPIIRNFDTNNAWIGFWASYSSAIAAIYVLNKTTQQTREIQNENLKNAIRPSIDIEVTNGLFVHYNVEKNGTINVSKLRIDGQNKYSTERSLDIIGDKIISIINLSQDNSAKNMIYRVEIETNQLITKLIEAGKDVKIEKKHDNVLRLNIEGKYSFLCLDENNRISSEFYERFLRPQKEIPIYLTSLYLQVDGILKILLDTYRKNALLKNSYNGEHISTDIELITLKVYIKYEDIQNNDYPEQEYKISFMLNSISQDNVFIIETKIVDNF